MVTHKHTHTQSCMVSRRRATTLGKKFQDVPKSKATFWALMKFKAQTHYGGDTNTLFHQPVSVDVCGFHGDREDAEERTQSNCSPVTRAWHTAYIL